MSEWRYRLLRRRLESEVAAYLRGLKRTRRVRRDPQRFDLAIERKI